MMPTTISKEAIMPGKYTDEEPPRTIRIEVPTNGKPKASGKSKSKAATGKLFQFKIILHESKPPIWRRIQVQDCTLDKLHEHIQTAMGWTNSHLHQFASDLGMF
jgi:hypothetical protein